MKIQTIITVSKKGKYLYKGEEVGGAIWATLKESAGIDAENDNYHFLLAEAKKQRFPSEWLLENVHNDLELDADFAIKLHWLDVIYPRSFKAKNKIGEAIIEVLESGDLCLLLYNRTWVGADCLILSFELCHLEHRFALQGKFAAGEVS
jgi:hypothetical protein